MDKVTGSYGVYSLIKIAMKMNINLTVTTLDLLSWSNFSTTLLLFLQLLRPWIFISYVGFSSACEFAGVCGERELVQKQVKMWR